MYVYKVEIDSVRAHVAAPGPAVALALLEEIDYLEPVETDKVALTRLPAEQELDVYMIDCTMEELTDRQREKAYEEDERICVKATIEWWADGAPDAGEVISQSDW